MSTEASNIHEDWWEPRGSYLSWPLDNLSNHGRRTLVMEVTGNLMVTLAELQLLFFKAAFQSVSRRRPHLRTRPRTAHLEWVRNVSSTWTRDQTLPPISTWHWTDFCQIGIHPASQLGTIEGMWNVDPDLSGSVTYMLLSTSPYWVQLAVVVHLAAFPQEVSGQSGSFLGPLWGRGIYLHVLMYQEALIYSMAWPGSKVPTFGALIF